MRNICLVVAAWLCAVAAFAQTASWPDGYWERQYGQGPQSSDMYMISYKVGTPADVREKARKILEQSGGRLSQRWSYGNALSYLVPVEKAEKVLKRLLALGDLPQFSARKAMPDMANPLPEIREKIAAIKGEQQSNAAAFATMPISRTLLASQLARLTQARDSYEASARTALISLALPDASASYPRNPMRSRYSSRHSPIPAPSPIPASQRAWGSLGEIRNALSLFYSDTEGRYPSTLADLTVAGKYLTKIPRIRIASHAETDVVTIVKDVSDMASLKAKLKDTGGWAYVGDPKSVLFGRVFVDCTHADSRGNPWLDF